MSLGYPEYQSQPHSTGIKVMYSFLCAHAYYTPIHYYYYYYIHCLSNHTSTFDQERNYPMVQIVCLIEVNGEW